MGAEERRFAVDPARLYEVGRDGTPRAADGAAEMQWLGPRHRGLILGAGAGAAVLGMLAGLTVFAFALGLRLWAAGFALATLAASPLPAIPPVLDWWRHRRRSHRTRPPHFPDG